MDPFVFFGSLPKKCLEKMLEIKEDNLHKFCFFFRFWVWENRFSCLNLDTTPRSRKIGKTLAIFFQSFISPQILAAAPIGFLFLKVLYLSFQMNTRVRSRVGATSWGESATPEARARPCRAFQISVELITEASLKKLLYAFSMGANCVFRVGQ